MTVTLNKFPNKEQKDLQKNNKKIEARKAAIKKWGHTEKGLFLSTSAFCALSLKT